MDMKELGKKSVDQLKIDGKVLLINQVALLFDEGMDIGAAELKALIPGTIDDAIIDMIEPQLKPLAKAYIMALIAKI